LNQAAGAGVPPRAQNNAPSTVAVSRSVKGAKGKPADHTNCLAPQDILHGAGLPALRQIKPARDVMPF